VSVATTLVAVFFGPAWKDRVDTRRASRQRSEQLLAQYSEPLARAAFDLQSRLYNICRQQLMTASNVPEDYRRFSTLGAVALSRRWARRTLARRCSDGSGEFVERGGESGGRRGAEFDVVVAAA
jgi:hypothetical protein